MEAPHLKKPEGKRGEICKCTIIERTEMSNELSIKRDSIDFATETLSPVRGVALKFQNSGDWTQGYDGESAADIGDLLLADVAEAWRFMMKGRPVEYVLREPGMPKPPRPGTFENESSWPLYNGEPSDPWSWVSILHFLSIETGTTYNFVASTVGARRARDELLEQVRSMRQITPGALPIVQLGVTSMPTQYGSRSRPMLRIRGWKRPASQSEASPRQIEVQAETIEAEPVKVKAKARKAKTPVGETLSETVNPYNDEIGF
jgi:hypothetical protein